MAGARPAHDGGTISIGQLAGLVGVSASTLRAWERAGLVSPARSAGRHRRYGPDAVARAREVRALLARGYSPTALRDLLATGRVSADAPMGARLRHARVRRGLSLRRAAEAARVASSYLSLIERGMVEPSDALLDRVADVYGITTERLRSEAVEAVSGRRLVRAAERQRARGFVKVEMENLVEFPGALMGLDIFTVAPGGGSGGHYSHEGEEAIVMLEGSLDLWLEGAEPYRLEAGDTLYFASAQRHRWRNPGPGIARVLWVNTPPTF